MSIKNYGNLLTTISYIGKIALKKNAKNITTEQKKIREDTVWWKSQKIQEKKWTRVLL